MASPTTAPLDIVVFDFSFDVADILPVVWRIGVEEVYRFIQAGQSVAVTVHIIDNMTTFGRRYPYNPSIPPTMSVYYPDGTLVTGSPFSMANLTIGIYTYTYNTQQSDPLGLYTATFHTINGTASMYTRKAGIFTILEPRGN